jgi:hypothetical protein
MSDAKAKAEARRAKILARDASKRIVSAVSTEDDVSIWKHFPPLKLVYFHIFFLESLNKSH